MGCRHGMHPPTCCCCRGCMTAASSSSSVRFSCGSIKAVAHFAPPPCSIITSRCIGKPSCTVRASNDVFGEPQAGELKALLIYFKCVTGVWGAWKRRGWPCLAMQPCANCMVSSPCRPHRPPTPPAGPPAGLPSDQPINPPINPHPTQPHPCRCVASNDKRFDSPQMYGASVEWCLGWGSTFNPNECGLIVADRCCCYRSPPRCCRYRCLHCSCRLCCRCSPC